MMEKNLYHFRVVLRVPPVAFVCLFLRVANFVFIESNQSNFFGKKMRDSYHQLSLTEMPPDATRLITDP